MSRPLAVYGLRPHVYRRFEIHPGVRLSRGALAI